MPPFFNRPPRVPDPGQRVLVRLTDGPWREGFRAISGPITDENGEVVVWVAEDTEYGQARAEERRPVGFRLPVERVKVPNFPLRRLLRG